MIDDEKVTELISKKAVKLHIFLPSGKSILTVVGRMHEYWVDVEQGYCTCKGYYFRSLGKDGQCYHIKTAKDAIGKGLVDKIVFNDEEYRGFLRALIHDIFKSINDR